MITLGIIGIISALTLPVLSEKTNEKVLESQNKKAKSILANGFKRLMANDEVTSLENTNLILCGNDVSCISSEIKKVFKIVHEVDDNSHVPSAYKQGNKLTNIWKNNTELNYSFITPDGMIFGIKKNENDTHSISIIADINGTKNPNEGGKDLCMYNISSGGTLTDMCSSMSEAEEEEEEKPYKCEEDAGCIKCSEWGTCTLCYYGYHLKDGKCVADN